MTFRLAKILDSLFFKRSWMASYKISGLLSHASGKTESENNRRAAQGTVTELHPAAH